MVKALRTALVLLGALLTAVGAVITVVYVFQPWRSCPYDDSPAACAMLPGDFAVMSSAMVGVLFGVVFLVTGLIGRRRAAR